ncbi:hypothetical protein HanIR_Chr13g0653301 [Helianthus annuus]|nr:hypothetical protein HanIR_Chr13g0653301 [Helianthus annuus]
MYTKSNYVNITITISFIKIDRWFHHLSHKSNFVNITISLSLSLIDHLLHFRVLHQKLIDRQFQVHHLCNRSAISSIFFVFLSNKRRQKIED